MNRVTIFDLSLPLEESPSELIPVSIKHPSHLEGAAAMKGIYGCKDSDLPQGMGWAVDDMTVNSHAGTHVDAPWHYFPTAEGKRSRTIDEIPLEWFFKPGVVLDMRHKESGSVITVEDIQLALTKLNYRIQPYDIVLIQTGMDKLWGKSEYWRSGCGMGRESTLHLIEQGVKVMGIDAWGWDPPASIIRAAFERTGNPNLIWAAHRAGIEREFCHIEKLANLDKLPVPFGFKVACFPVKIGHGSAGWSRVVAIIDN
jgi:kynurenine formamidase